MKWIITYTRDWHYRDRDNYPACNSGEAETAEGDTLKEAIKTLIRSEASPSMIESYAENKYEGYSSIEIISAYKVTKEVELEFEKIPTIKKMIDKKERQLANKKANEIIKENADKVKMEKAMLKKLKEKYA